MRDIITYDSPGNEQVRNILMLDVQIIFCMDVIRKVTKWEKCGFLKIHMM